MEQVSVACISAVLRWLPARVLLRSATVSRAWSAAGLLRDTWHEHRLLSDKLLFKDTIPSSNNIRIFSDEDLFRVARRLRDVACQTRGMVSTVGDGGTKETCASLPLHPTDGNASRASQLEVARYQYNATELWFLQYNTTNFGWMHDASTLGLKVWPACRGLCQYLCSSAYAPVVLGKRCLEVGAGIGFLGVVLQSLGAAVTVTDHDETCLRVATVNARLNGAHSICIRRLLYGESAAEVFAEEHGRFDFLFAADVVYGENSPVPLFETAERLLAEDGAFYLSYTPRKESITLELFRAATAAGFCWEEPSAPAEATSKGIHGTLAAMRSQLAAGNSLSSAFLAVTGTERLLVYCFGRLPASYLHEMD